MSSNAHQELQGQVPLVSNNSCCWMTIELNCVVPQVCPTCRARWDCSMPCSLCPSFSSCPALALLPLKRSWQQRKQKRQREHSSSSRQHDVGNLCQHLHMQKASACIGRPQPCHAWRNWDPDLSTCVLGFTLAACLFQEMLSASSF